MPTKEAGKDAFSRNQNFFESIHLHFPVFHTRSMQKETFSKLGRVVPSVKPSVV